MTTMTSSLILSLVDQVTGPARAAARSVDGLRAAAARNAKQMQAVQGQLLGAVGAAVALAAAVRAPIKAAMEFEAQMASVSTLVDTSTESMADMGREVLEIAKRTPVAIADLTSGLYDVRSAGIAAGEAMSVLEGSARLAVAGLGTTKQATDLVTSSINAFNIPAQEQARLYDVIFKTVKNGKTTIAELSQGFGAVAGTVANAGIEIDEYFASVAALTTAGLPAAQAHTQIRAAIAGLTRETKQSSKIFRALGVKTFAELVEKSGGMVNAFSLIREQVGGNDAEMIKLLGSVEAYNAVLGLSGSVNGKYAQTLDDMRNGVNAVDEAFEKQSATTRRTIQMFMNSMVQLAVSIGDSLLPALRATLAVIGPITSAIAQWAQANPALISSIVGLVAGLVGLRLVTLSARWAFLFLKGGLIDVAIGVARSSGAIVAAVKSIGAIAFAPVVSGFMVLRKAIIGYSAAAAIAGHGAALKMLGTGLLGLLNPMKLVTMAMRVLKLAVIGTGIGAVLVGIAAAGTWIYNNWSGIATMFEAFKGAFSRAISPIMPAIEPVVDVFSSMYAAISSLLGPIDQMGGGWASAGIAAGKFVGDLLIAVAELPGKIAAGLRATYGATVEGIKNIIAGLKALAGEMAEAGKMLMDALLEGIKAGADAVTDYVKSIGSRIKSSITGAATGALGRIRNAVGLGGGPEAANDNSAIAGTRAAGGAIVGGRTYLVGEHGPELVTPSRSGYVHDADATSAMMGGRRGGVAAGAGGKSVHMGGVTIQVIAQPGMDPQAIARAVNEALGKIAGDALSGGQFDREWSVA